MLDSPITDHNVIMIHIELTGNNAVTALPKQRIDIPSAMKNIETTIFSHVLASNVSNEAQICF